MPHSALDQMVESVTKEFLILYSLETNILICFSRKHLIKTIFLNSNFKYLIIIFTVLLQRILFLLIGFKKLNIFRWTNRLFLQFFVKSNNTYTFTQKLEKYYDTFDVSLYMSCGGNLSKLQMTDFLSTLSKEEEFLRENYRKRSFFRTTASNLISRHTTD